MSSLGFGYNVVTFVLAVVLAGVLFSASVRAYGKGSNAQHVFSALCGVCTVAAFIIALKLWL